MKKNQKSFLEKLQKETQDYLEHSATHLLYFYLEVFCVAIYITYLSQVHALLGDAGRKMNTGDPVSGILMMEEDRCQGCPEQDM